MCSSVKFNTCTNLHNHHLSLYTESSIILPNSPYYPFVVILSQSLTPGYLCYIHHRYGFVFWACFINGIIQAPTSFISVLSLLFFLLALGLVSSSFSSILQLKLWLFIWNISSSAVEHLTFKTVFPCLVV